MTRTAHYSFPAACARLACTLACCAFLLSCMPAPGGPPATPMSGAPRPRIQVASLEQRIHRLINRERANHGLGSLRWDDDLSRIARKHSEDMGRRGFFSHDSPEGRDFSDRYLQEGYVCSLRTGNTIHLGAENIALNNLYDSVTTVNGKAYFNWNTEERIAETTVAGWMQSPGHRRNILSPSWKREGIGLFISTDDRIYITQNFC